MSNSAELAAVLRRVAELLSRDDVDTVWSGYEPDELRSEIRSLLESAETGLPLDEAGRGRLQVLFALTGALQETSLSSGWGEEFIELAGRFDNVLPSLSTRNAKNAAIAGNLHWASWGGRGSRVELWPADAFGEVLPGLPDPLLGFVGIG